MQIFLTGGTGFIGSHVVSELVLNNHSVTILARNKNKVPALLQLPNTKIIQGDISEKESYKDELKGKDAVIHLFKNF